MLNSFAHRIATRRIKFSFGRKNFGQKLAEAFGVDAIDPFTFVPDRLDSKSMTLTEVELAFFVSFPQEYDIQTINFGMGPTPTFVHSNTQEMDETDLTIQCNHEALQEDVDRLNGSIVSRLRVSCTKCSRSIWIKKDGKGSYMIDMA